MERRIEVDFKDYLVMFTPSLPIVKLNHTKAIVLY